MQEEQAIDFYKRVTQGKKHSKTISLEHSSGSTLDDVEMHPVSKRELASVIERLPEAMFEAVEEAEGDVEEAEENIEQEANMTMGAVTESTVDAFEDLCKSSIRHPDLAPPQMHDIVDNLNFEVLFELGTEIIDMSVESDGSVKDFHAQG